MNEDTKKPLIFMILFGIVRHVMFGVGMYLENRGLISPDTKDRMMSEGTATVVGYVLMIIPIAWSIAQKTQVWTWVRTALKINSSTIVPSDVPKMAPGPDTPL